MKTTPAITVAEVTTLAQSLGLAITEQTAFTKIAAGRKAVYINRPKSGVITRCDISGFTVAHAAVRPPLKKNGKVTGQVVFTDATDARWAIVEAIESLLDPTVEGNRVLLGAERARFETAASK